MRRAVRAWVIVLGASALACNDGVPATDGGRRDLGSDGLRFHDRGRSDGPVDAPPADLVDLGADAPLPDLPPPADLAPPADLLDACVGSCASRVCGDDGCGGLCGTCGADHVCVDGACAAKVLQLAVSGTPELVWPYNATYSCAIADGPVRMARDAAGRAMMFIAHAKNYRMQSITLDGTLQLAANALPQLVYASPQVAVESAYESRMWISSLWTDDGSTIRALAHHEWYHPSLYVLQPPQNCLVSPSAIFGWVNAVQHLVSTDGGASFAPTKPYLPAMASNANRLVLGPETFTWQNVSKPVYPAGEVRYGFFRPSNLAKAGAHHYTVVAVDELVRNTPGGADYVVPPRRGLALLRTTDVAAGWSNGAWEHWDGAQWAAISGLLPLGAIHVFTDDPSCAPPRTVVGAADPAVAGDLFSMSSSLTYSNVGKRWVLLGHTGATRRAAYTSTEDLAQPQWAPLRAVAGSDAVMLGTELHPWTKVEGGQTVADWTASYPAIVDHASAGKVYMYSGAAPHLYYVRSRGGVARDIYRVRLAATLQ